MLITIKSLCILPGNDLASRFITIFIKISFLFRLLTTPRLSEEADEYLAKANDQVVLQQFLSLNYNGSAITNVSRMPL